MTSPNCNQKSISPLSRYTETCLSFTSSLQCVAALEANLRYANCNWRLSWVIRMINCLHWSLPTVCWDGFTRSDSQCGWYTAHLTWVCQDWGTVYSIWGTVCSLFTVFSHLLTPFLYCPPPLKHKQSKEEITICFCNAFLDYYAHRWSTKYICKGT